MLCVVILDLLGVHWMECSMCEEGWKQCDPDIKGITYIEFDEFLNAMIRFYFLWSDFPSQKAVVMYMDNILSTNRVRARKHSWLGRQVGSRFMSTEKTHYPKTPYNLKGKKAVDKKHVPGIDCMPQTWMWQPLRGGNVGDSYEHAYNKIGEQKLKRIGAVSPKKKRAQSARLHSGGKPAELRPLSAPKAYTDSTADWQTHWTPAGRSNSESRATSPDVVVRHPHSPPFSPATNHSLNTKMHSTVSRDRDDVNQERGSSTPVPPVNLHSTPSLVLNE